MVEVELARMLEGIAEITGSYGGPDYTSIIKHFDPIPLRQTQPFKHNKRPPVLNYGLSFYCVNIFAVSG